MNKPVDIPAEHQLQRLKAAVPGLSREIGQDAARRERERELPFEAFAAFRASGLGTLRIPVALGGPGGSVSDYVELIADLAAGESNVAHALRNHFNYTEGLVLRSFRGEADPLGLERALSGAIFAGAHTENLTRDINDVSTRLVRDGADFRLTGRKWYATGTAYADYGSFSALNDEGAPVSVLIPLDRPGVAVHDDWDGMGQRMTASGGVTLENVPVFASEVQPRENSFRIGRHCSTLRQLHLAATVAGAVRGIVKEGVDYVLNRARTAAHSATRIAAEDPFVQRSQGEIAAISFGIDAAVREAARALDSSATAFAQGDEAVIDRALIEAAIATARAQVVSADLALSAANKIFELGGGSATSRDLNLDRYWRNIRTVLNHNPIAQKARVIGDYYLNGATTHLEEGRFF